MDGDDREVEQQGADNLEAYVARLLADRAPELPEGLERDDLHAYLMAAALAGSRPGAADPPADVRARLNTLLDETLSRRGWADAVRPRRLSRREGITAAVGLTAGVLVGVAVDRTVRGGMAPPTVSAQDLVGSNGRWYDVAATTAVPVGAVRRFTAGGVDGYLLNEHGRIWALSAICTHMGCHVNWADAHGRFECLCHAATFNRYGRPNTNRPLAPLPAIQVRVQGDRIYVWGTQTAKWGW